MITTYHRPQTLEEALALLNQPNTLPLGGGTLLSKPTQDSFSVVDLQRLGLDEIRKKGNDLEVGAGSTLQALMEFPGCPQSLKTAIQLEAARNIRNTATVAGTLVASDGRSPFATMLMAMDVKLERRLLSPANGEPVSVVEGISEFLLTRPAGLIVSITIPSNNRTAFEYVSRTPMDKPIVSAALCQWNSGRSRLALGGVGKTPLLAMDGTEADGLEIAAQNAFHEAGDEWASADYRMDAAATLARRCLTALA